MLRLTTPITVGLLLLLSACGGSQPSPETTTAADEVQPEGLPRESAIALLGTDGPDKPWAEMNYSEKEWYMVGKVHPVMREVFAKFDSRFGQFHCEECHGRDAKEHEYKMPSAHLSMVPALDSAEYAEIQGSRFGTFMREEVTEVMASLLGKEAMTEGAGAITCHSCHPQS